MLGTLLKAVRGISVYRRCGFVSAFQGGMDEGGKLPCDVNAMHVRACQPHESPLREDCNVFRVQIQAAPMKGLPTTSIRFYKHVRWMQGLECGGKMTRRSTSPFATPLGSATETCDIPERFRST